MSTWPMLGELVPACGALTNAYLQPPTPELASTLFSDAISISDRIERLVGELSALYERAGGAFVGVRREAHLLEPLREWLEDSMAQARYRADKVVKPPQAFFDVMAWIGRRLGYSID